MSHFGNAVRDWSGCIAPADKLGGDISAAPARSAQARAVVHNLDGSALSIVVL